jgi:RimJ/RimL family protein N-acetyltransferase
MLIEANEGDFAALMAGKAPQNLRLAADVELAPPPVLDMLAGLAQTIRDQFAPSAWMIVAEGEIVGLTSITRMPENGQIHIGYGIASARQRRGHATGAVAALLAWAATDERVTSVSAETGLDNIASQRVLERNGFSRTGERYDPEDGPLICWRADLA